MTARPVELAVIDMFPAAVTEILFDIATMPPKTLMAPVDETLLLIVKSVVLPDLPKVKALTLFVKVKFDNVRALPKEVP